MTIVWFIRHGESEANAGLPTTNPVATRLTEKGLWQAQQIALAFTEAPELIITSPYLRTQQTAQPTCERFSTIPQAEWCVQEFTYLATNHYQDTTIQQRRPLSDAYWQQGDPLYVDGLGAESFANLLHRVQTVHTQIQQSEAKWIVVFSHGRFMRAMLWSVLTQSVEASPKRMKQFQAFIASFSVPNGSILKLQIASEIWFSGIDTAHLISEYSDERTSSTLH